MKTNKKKFLISILTISTIAIASSAAIGITSVSQTQNDANSVLSDSIETYTSVPMPGPTMDDPKLPSTGNGNNGSVVTSEYEIDWSKKTSPTGNVYFDGELAYTNSQRTVLLGMDPNTKKTEVNLPSSVNEIKGYTTMTSGKTSKHFVGAFEGMQNLVSVSIGGSNVKIDANAFKGCTKLENVMMQNNAIRSIGESAFEGCTSLKTINLSSSLITIEAKAFKNTSSLSQINLPISLKTIKESAFEGSGLTTLDMSKTKVSTISNNAFKNTTKLTNLTFSKSISGIGSSAFENSNISKIFLTTTSLPTIGSSAFKGCSNLVEFKSTARTSNLKSIPMSLFENCTNLSVIQFSQPSSTISFKSIGDNAFKGTKITTFDISGTQLIGESAFENCELLTSLTGQNVLQTIGNKAFKGSGLKVISSTRGTPTSYVKTTLSNILTIGESAFYGTKIQEFVSGSYLTTIGNDSFKNIDTLQQVNFTLSKDLIKNTNAFDEKDQGKVSWPTKRVFRGNKIIF